MPVRPQPIPAARPSEAPLSLLLSDEQARLERGKITAYSETAIKFLNAQGLTGANVVALWQPATDTVTVNKLQIRRGDKVIDVLAAGQTFTVLRRETNLDAATLDGTLTATLQPEGLQVGDIVDFAFTLERSDPVMKGHVEAMFGAWDGVPIQAAHAAVSWPADVHLELRETPNLPPAQKSSAAGLTSIELAGTDVQPLVPPKGAPARFTIGRLAEATDFTSWSDMANLFAPLYRQASAIPATGPLHDEVEKIRAASSNPKVRAEQALALVQDRVRYVALLMGQGGYVPAPAETTWSRRFGDCKGKTVLLLGILHALGIEAEPALAQVGAGDIVADRLPMVALFNHVLVRAHITGKDYWLDGTRNGDTDIDAIETPDFGWSLPLVANARLVHMVPAPLAVPKAEHHIDVDATGGIYAPAAVIVEEIYRGDTAVELNTAYSALTAGQRDEAIHGKAISYLDTFKADSSSVQFDRAKRELRLTMKGTGKLDWKDGWFNVPQSSLAFDPDFDRPAGPLHDVPWAIKHPSFIRDEVVIRLPAGVAAQQKLHAPVHETLEGVEYVRTETVDGNALKVVSSERSVASEVPYKEAVAAAPRLRALNKDNVYLRVPDGYHATNADLPVLAEQSPTTADAYLARGNVYLNSGKNDEAIVDFTETLKLDLRNQWALVDRAIAYSWKLQFEAAQKDLAAAEMQNADSTFVARARGLLAELQGKCADAVDFYTRSLVTEADGGFAHGHRALCEAQLGKNDEALADAAEALKLDSSWIQLRLLRANILMGKGDREAVAHEADLMVKENPQSSLAFISAARSLAAIGQRDKAMPLFERALAIKPEAYIYLNRAQIRTRSDMAGKLADLDAALKIAPGDADALVEKARLLTNSGDYKGAVAIFDQVKADAGDQYVEMQHAVALYKAGRRTEAEKLLAALAAKAQSPVQLNNLCWSKAIAGIALDSALEECRAALNGAPGTGGFLDSLGMTLLKLGRLDEALDAYNEAVAKNSGADSLMGRAFVYLRKGDRTHAEADAAAARKLSGTIDDIFADYGLKIDEPAPVDKKAATAK